MTEFTTETNQYHIASHGNGWAYGITCQATGCRLWFQDHDADQIQADTDNFSNEAAITQYFECLFN